MYCLKCRKATGNRDLYIGEIIVKGNKRPQEKCFCVECGMRKNRLISVKTVIADKIPVIADEMTPEIIL